MHVAGRVDRLIQQARIVPARQLRDVAALAPAHRGLHTARPRVAATGRNRLQRVVTAVELRAHVAGDLVGRHRTDAERDWREVDRHCVDRSWDVVRLVLAIVQRRQLVGVVGLRELDADDFARLRQCPRRRLALGVEPIVDAVGIARAAEDRVDSIENDDTIEVVDRRGLADVEKGLDRVLEFLGVAVGRRVPDPVEQRTQDVRLQREDPAIEVFIRHDLCVARIDLGRQAARVVGVAPADRTVDREPLPLLERISHLRVEIDAAQAPVVDFNVMRLGASQQVDVFSTGGEIQWRPE